jgi:hypothetical protein
MEEIKKIERTDTKKGKPKFWKRRIGMFGKQIPVVALVLVAVGGLGSASLLLYFGQIKTTANVEQAVTLLGSPTHTIPEAAPGGEEFCYLHKLDNKASVDIDVGFTTTCKNATINNGGSCPEIKTGTKIYEPLETQILTLCKKNPTNWQCIGGATATLTFDPVSPTFDYTLTAIGLAANTGYKLIYYPDAGATGPSGKPWNMDNAVPIGTGTTDDSGGLSMSGNAELGINMPLDGDYNAEPNIGDSYCYGENGYDYYNHCHGAKIWLITGDINNNNWNPTAWLFETDLIVYSDCNLEPSDIEWENDRGNEITEPLKTFSKKRTPFLVCYKFPIGTIPGNYELTTNIVPQ